MKKSTAKTKKTSIKKEGVTSKRKTSNVLITKKTKLKKVTKIKVLKKGIVKNIVKAKKTSLKSNKFIKSYNQINKKITPP